MEYPVIEPFHIPAVKFKSLFKIGKLLEAAPLCQPLKVLYLCRKRVGLPFLIFISLISSIVVKSRYLRYMKGSNSFKNLSPREMSPATGLALSMADLSHVSPHHS